MSTRERNRQTHPRYGDRTACRVCGSNIEYHGPEHRWIDRGGNTYCDTSGQARWDQDGCLVPFPHRKHEPVNDNG